MVNHYEHIVWSKELRKLVENHIKEFEQKRVIEELEEIIRKTPPTPKGTAVKYVREDRDSY